MKPRETDGGADLLVELPPVSRRNFIKRALAAAGIVSAGVSVGRLLEALTTAGPDGVALARGVVVVDRDLCAGCRTCEAVCTNYNDRGRASPIRARIILEKQYLEGEYEPKVCFQCSEPLCLYACPVAALQIDTALGTRARIIDEQACIGCRRCVEACDRVFSPPRPRFDPERRVTTKCHLCFGDPQCVRYCPYGALSLLWSLEGIRSGYPVVREDQ